MLKRLKDQRGLTLIELLVVVVILGIIAAIAVPSVGGLIENSKKDAFVGSAQQVINATKIYITSQKTTPGSVTIADLQSKGYIEKIKDPWGIEDITGTVTIGGTANARTYSIHMTNGTKSIGADGTPIAETALKREDVTP